MKQLEFNFDRDCKSKPKEEWEKQGFKSRSEWLKACEWDRAFRHQFREVKK